MPIIAAIDLGTNTARLYIGDTAADEPLLLKRKIVRLGGGFTHEQGIAPDAWDRGLSVMNDFRDELARYAVTDLWAVATSAVRDAVNGLQFCSTVKQATGIDLNIIDGQTEALLTLKGIRTGIISAAPYQCVFDIGGGSTEYIVAENFAPIYSTSLPLGVVRLTEGKPSIEAISQKINKELKRLYLLMKDNNILPLLNKAELIATAGTATTLAAVKMEMEDYDYRKVNNFVLSQKSIESIYVQLLSLTPDERLKIKGMERGREDLILAGVLLTLETMDLFGFNSLKVSDFGLLEGVFQSVIDRSVSV